MVNGALKLNDCEVLSASSSFQRLRRVDVEEGALAVDGHFGDRLGVLGDQMPRADVAVERHQLLEEAARPQHGIAAAALADWHDNEIAAVRRKAVDEAIDQAGID